MNDLIKIYNNKLIDALFYGDDYLDLKRQYNINNRIMNFDFINQFLNKVILECNMDGFKFDFYEVKLNVLMVINDMRFNYNFKNEREKNAIYDLINMAIVSINTTDNSAPKIANHLNQSGDDFKLSYEKYDRSFGFKIVYYYLMADELFDKLAIPYFLENLGLYISSFSDILDEYPELLKEKDIFYRTKKIFLEAITSFKLKGNELTKYEKVKYKTIVNLDKKYLSKME